MKNKETEDKKTKKQMEKGRRECDKVRGGKETEKGKVNFLKIKREGKDYREEEMKW